jgi:hypothetical protein
MNRKAVFFTLTAVLIIGMIVFFLSLSQKEEKRAGEVTVQFQKQQTLADYVVNIEKHYLPQLIETSEKMALQELTKYVDSHSATLPDLRENLSTVVAGNNSLLPAQLTLPVMVNDTFNTITSPVRFRRFAYQTTGIDQIDEWNLRVSSRVRFTIESLGNINDGVANFTWSNELTYTHDISIYGLEDPTYHDPITNKWITDSSRQCYSYYIDTSMTCGSILGLCPLSGC